MNKYKTTDLPCASYQLHQLASLEDNYIEDAIAFNPDHLHLVDQYLLPLMDKGIPTPYIYPQPGFFSDYEKDTTTSNVRCEWDINDNLIVVTFYCSLELVHLSCYNHKTNEQIESKTKLNFRANKIIFDFIKDRMFCMTHEQFTKLDYKSLNGIYFISRKVVRYYKDGKLHRTDGPAYIICGNNKILEKKTILSKKWYIEGKLHRDNGPAVELVSYYNDYNNGYKRAYHLDKKYYKNGRLHRSDGPAYVGVYQHLYYVNGLRHREDGPAIEWIDHQRADEFFFRGKKYSSMEEIYMVKNKLRDFM